MGDSHLSATPHLPKQRQVKHPSCQSNSGQTPTAGGRSNSCLSVKSMPHYAALRYATLPYTLLRYAM
eukprot:3204944-Karenia_brevis.AAC.1